jgi:hypothetical protein
LIIDAVDSGSIAKLGLSNRRILDFFDCALAIAISELQLQTVYLHVDR